jgi:hypothetical protein
MFATMTRKAKCDEMRSHYDFSRGVRGKYAARYAEGTNVVVLGPDDGEPMSGRTRRDSDEDNCFPQPDVDDWDTPVWRYMDLWKFESFLSKGLYFSRLDQLGDEWEAALPSGTVANLDALLTACPELKPFKAEVLGGWKLDYESLKKDTFVSCWQLSRRELWWMWKVYCETERAVAIRTTYARLDECLPPCHQEWPAAFPLLMGKVRYGPYDSIEYSTELGRRFGVAMSKRDCFQDEREVRVLFDYGAVGREKPGAFIKDVDVDRLLTSIVVSPVAPQSLRHEVEAMVRKAGCQTPVEDSPIRKEPPTLW